MTFVSSASVKGTSYNSPTLAAGDIVVLFCGGDSGVYGNQNAIMQPWAGPINKPSGWEQAAGPWTMLLVAPIGYGFTTHAVFWRRATGTSLSASFGRPLLIQSIVLRNVTSIAGVLENEINASTFTYPPLTFENPMTGHVLHYATTEEYNTLPIASGDTVRQSETIAVGGTEAQKIKNRVGAPISVHTGAVVSEKPFTAASSVAAASSGIRVDGHAVTLAFATVSGPAAPTIITPLAGSVDLAAGFNITWTPIETQTAFAIRRKQGAGAYQWWNGTDWSASSEFIISGTSTTVTVPAAQFLNAATAYTIEVATVGDALRPSLGTYATVAVVGKASPTISSAVVSPLSGSNITSMTPTITFTGAAGSGGSLSGYRARIDQDLGDGWVQVLDSGTVPSPWTVSVAQAASLTNGAPTRVRSVTVQDTVQESAVNTSATYTLAAPVPATPVVTTTATTHPVSGLPGVQITVNSGTSGSVTIYRNNVAVHTSQIVAGFPLLVSDYAALSGSNTYKVQTTTGDGVTTVQVYSAFGYSTYVVPSTSRWITDDLHPELAVRIVAATFSMTHGTRSSTFLALDSDKWLVHSGGQVQPRGSAAITTVTPNDRGKAIVLLASGRKLRFRGIQEADGLGGSWNNNDIEIFVDGDINEDYIVNEEPITWRTLSFNWVSA